MRRLVTSFICIYRLPFRSETPFEIKLKEACTSASSNNITNVFFITAHGVIALDMTTIMTTDISTTIITTNTSNLVLVLLILVELPPLLLLSPLLIYSSVLESMY